MKYYSTLPLTAFVALLSINALLYFGIVPSGLVILEGLQSAFADYGFLLTALIILLESIVYIGFYFPGQFFAVLLVVLTEPTWLDIIWLTLAMVVAATTGSLINYTLGKRLANPDLAANNKRNSWRKLLLAMMHINSLAFFMFNQGAQRKSRKVVLLAGLMNLPYYLILVTITASLSEQVLALAESGWVLATAIAIWLLVALYLDVRRNKLQLQQKQTMTAQQ